MEGQVLKITPVLKSGYALTSYHDKYITVTGNMTIDIKTKVVTKGKLKAPVLMSGSAGMVDSSYIVWGKFENPNNVSVTAKADFYYIDESMPHMDSPHAAAQRTMTLVAGDYNTFSAEGPSFIKWKGKHLIAIKFSAVGYEDSDYSFWSDYSSLVNSTAYTTGQIPELILNEGQQNSHGVSLEDYAEYEVEDDGEYTIYIEAFGRLPFRWPITMLSPKGAEILNFKYLSGSYGYVYKTLTDVPTDNLKIQLTCYDPLGLFKSTSVQITSTNLTELETSDS
jgi:hypothetical protein